MKKVLKKVTALAAALMMVPVMTVNAAPPVDLEVTKGRDVYKEIDDKFPGLTELEIGVIAEMTMMHSDVEQSYGTSMPFDKMLEVCGVTLNDSYGHIIAAYGVVFADASRDWCISKGVNAAEMDAVIAKLRGSAGAPGTSQSASAPTWKNDANGWWVENPDGSYLTNQWYQSPDSGLWYYMGSDGYMLTNTTTPDGCTVDAEGVWVQ